MRSQTGNASTFSGYEKFVIAILAFLQFTIILDFMIISPLGAMIMPAFNMSSEQFGYVVSAYAFSAGISGILAAGFADRFDRKKILLFFYLGFLLGTLFCALAPNYLALLFARIVTGLFGGVIGSVVAAIATDLFAFEVRGRVVGFIQSAFAGSQVLGIPLGLFFANHWGWHAPFLMIVVIGAIVGVVIFLKVKPVTSHLLKTKPESAFSHLLKTVTDKKYFPAFIATSLLSIGGFMIMPFGSAFAVNNMKIEIEKLPVMYLLTGLSALFIGPFVGRLADRFGKFKVFVFGSLLTVLMSVIYTNRDVTPFYLAVIINIFLFVGIFSRMIPSQAMISAIPEPSSRGAFMSVSSSLQQFSGGIASIIAGLIVVRTVNGPLLHFNILGYILVATTILSLFLMYRIQKNIILKKVN